MIKKNKFSDGDASFQFILSPQEAGQVGVLFKTAVFDESVGSETYLLYLEEEKYAEKLVNIRPFM